MHRAYLGNPIVPRSAAFPSELWTRDSLPTPPGTPTSPQSFTSIPAAVKPVLNMFGPESRGGRIRVIPDEPNPIEYSISRKANVDGLHLTCWSKMNALRVLHHPTGGPTGLKLLVRHLPILPRPLALTPTYIHRILTCRIHGLECNGTLKISPCLNLRTSTLDVCAPFIQRSYIELNSVAYLVGASVGPSPQSNFTSSAPKGVTGPIYMGIWDIKNDGTIEVSWVDSLGRECMQSILRLVNC